MMGKPLAPRMRVVGHIQQHLFTDPRRAPALAADAGLRRQDHHQLLGMQAMADKPRQVVAGHADGGIDFAGVEVDGFNA
ncbi:hypothetical protein D3C76_643170 [compost metagenome]